MTTREQFIQAMRTATGGKSAGDSGKFDQGIFERAWSEAKRQSAEEWKLGAHGHYPVNYPPEYFLAALDIFREMVNQRDQTAEHMGEYLLNEQTFNALELWLTQGIEIGEK